VELKRAGTPASGSLCGDHADHVDRLVMVTGNGSVYGSPMDTSVGRRAALGLTVTRGYDAPWRRPGRGSGWPQRTLSAVPDLRETPAGHTVHWFGGGPAENRP